MPRTPADATRFTATGPHAHSKTTATTIDLGAAPPPNETPAQKVARLREASRRAKISQESTWDRVVSRGRVWADRAHKITATALIATSVIATGVAVLSIGDMMYQNRGKKTAWIAEQQANYDRALSLARQAEKDGTLTDDLRMFLVKEHAIEQVEAEQKERGGIFQRAKASLFGGFTKEETKGGNLAKMLTREERQRRFSNEDMERMVPGAGARPISATEQAAGETLGALGDVGVLGGQAERTTSDPSEQYNRSSIIQAGTIMRTTPPARGGGYLDQLAANSASAILTTARGWTGLGGK